MFYGAQTGSFGLDMQKDYLLVLIILLYVIHNWHLIWNFLLLLMTLQLEEGEEFLDNLNPCTRRETAALGDSNMRNLKQGEILQLERKGYFRCDVPFLGPSKSIVLFAIPDGRQQASLNWIGEPRELFNLKLLAVLTRKWETIWVCNAILVIPVTILLDLIYIILLLSKCCGNFVVLVTSLFELYVLYLHTNWILAIGFEWTQPTHGKAWVFSSSFHFSLCIWSIWDGRWEE